MVERIVSPEARSGLRILLALLVALIGFLVLIKVMTDEHLALGLGFLLTGIALVV